MHWNPLSRRMFLRGATGALLVPLLPSLLPKGSAKAAGLAPTSALRYLQLTSTLGSYGVNFYPKDLTGLTAQPDGGPSTKKLTDVDGDVSIIFGSGFDAYRSKMSLVRGLNVLAGSTIHNGSFPTCGSGTAQAGDRSAPVFPYSIDAILADSSKIYPSAVGVEKHVNVSGVNFSWTRIAGKTQKLPAVTDTASLMSRFTSVSNAEPPESPTKLRQADVIQAVYEDYTRVRNSARLSSVDKERLQAFVQLIDETQQGLNVAAKECTDPTQAAEPTAATLSDEERAIITKNRINIMVAMLACGVTRVASMNILGGTGGGSGSMHEDTHDAKVTVHANYYKENAKNIAYLLAKMDSIADVDGTMLDNSLVYWGNEFGECQKRSVHQTVDMTIMLAGGAGGRLRMGEYIDFATGTPTEVNTRKGLQRRPFNNFLITLLNAMGLGSTDYERNDVIGFGEYHAPLVTSFGFEPFLSSNAKRRAPLPYLYTGPDLG